MQAEYQGQKGGKKKKTAILIYVHGDTCSNVSILAVEKNLNARLPPFLCYLSTTKIVQLMEIQPGRDTQ